MLSVLKRLGIGFIYGLGFALGVAGVLVLTMFGGASYLTSATDSSIYFGSGETRSNSDQFAISDTSAIKNQWGAVNVLGTIENKGDNTLHYVNVYADLFNKNGKFIYQCTHQFTEGLRKGQQANFMIECHGMPADLVPSYESFKVYARTY